MRAAIRPLVIHRVQRRCGECGLRLGSKVKLLCRVGGAVTVEMQTDLQAQIT